MSTTPSNSASVPGESSGTLDAFRALATPQSTSRPTPAAPRTPPTSGTQSTGNPPHVDSSQPSAAQPSLDDVKVTPRVPKPGPSARTLYNTKNLQKQDATRPRLMWAESMMKGFKGVVSMETFFKEYLPSSDDDSAAVTNIQERADVSLSTAKDSLDAARNENGTSEPLLNYLKEVVSNFPEGNKPVIQDTHNTEFPGLNKHEHPTKPDLGMSRPGLSATIIIRVWTNMGTIKELKWDVDLIDAATGRIRNSKEARDALVQLCKSGRNLLGEHGGCHVYVLTGFNRSLCRIFRFDRGGFVATEAFDWLKETDILPRFLHRLYNTFPGRMVGDDDTISIPSKSEKKEMYDRLCDNAHYNQRYQTVEEATKKSLWIKAAVNRVVDNKTVSEVVRCFTFGEPLSIVDSLFGRATRVYRVILEDDKSESAPTVFALKDSWRQTCRRPEVDYYDVIARYCEKNNIDMDEEGMVRCHGSLDLADEGQSWDSSLHVTSDAAEQGLERRHTRLLLTPVGGPLNEFKSTKALAKALSVAVRHLQIASDAGVMHRDVSEGNLLLQEAPDEHGEQKAFLLDWDYAEFTPEGLKFFETEFETRAKKSTYTEIKKSLKDFTGTLPFIAIGVLERNAHAKHHDLESIYWLLIWMMLRHTAHTERDGPLACNALFGQWTDDARSTIKRGHLDKPFGYPKGPLLNLLDDLARQVKNQNPSLRFRDSPKHMTHEEVLATFATHLASDGWPPADKAIEFSAPELKTETHGLSIQTVHQSVSRSSQKRRADELELDGDGDYVPTTRLTPAESQRKRSAPKRARKDETNSNQAPTRSRGGGKKPTATKQPEPGRSRKVSGTGRQR
ncbi:Pkinase-fungal domain-containing protein [Favolaschia claudopus]|uniref:Pkinase-fungal domain-containing protein n=1 Tax=Favolaschia claudopus TaxID=2862362 RepID=A0AAW0A1T9_9AGAR